jgi:hypothetical protein
MTPGGAWSSASRKSSSFKNAQELHVLVRGAREGVSGKAERVGKRLFGFLEPDEATGEGFGFGVSGTSSP